MKVSRILSLQFIAIVILNGLASGLSAQLIIEPDDFAEGTDLRTINPLITMSVITSTSPTPFSVTANDDGFGLASTGTKVFGHANVPFWNDSRRLVLDFSTPVREVSIDANGDFSINPEIGVLEIYDGANNLLDTYTTQELSGQHETMSLLRAERDISRAIAYASNGPFLRLDHLVVQSVPEPLGCVVFASGTILLLSRRRRS